MSPIVWFLYLPIYLQILLIYFVLINIITFFYFGIDKARSEMQRQRVSEKRLWLLSFIGGSIGAMLGMHFFRHKTKKMSFQAGIAVILTIQIYLLFYLIKFTIASEPSW